MRRLANDLDGRNLTQRIAEYLDIATPMLGASGEPRGELFAFDGLHLSREGYRVWTDVIRSRLLARHPPR